MKQLIIICVLCFVTPLFAADKDVAKYRAKVRKEYHYKAIDQKYAYNHARREVHNQGKLRILRAKYNQKVRGRNRYNYYGPIIVRQLPEKLFSVPMGKREVKNG